MATMVLRDRKTGEIFGYFGTPYPTFDDAVQMCFDNFDPWNDDYVTTEDEREVSIDSLELTFSDSKTMMDQIDRWVDDLSQEVRDVISDTDPDVFGELFGGIESVEELEEFVKRELLEAE